MDIKPHIDLSVGPNFACHSSVHVAGEREGMGGKVEVAQSWACHNRTKPRDTTCQGCGGNGVKDFGDYLNDERKSDCNVIQRQDEERDL